MKQKEIIIICPKCKEEVMNLNFSKTTEHWGSVGLIDGEMEFDEEFDICEHQKEYTYKCPSCGEVLFNTFEEAEEFLKGK